jgi:hypothetical protein
VLLDVRPVEKMHPGRLKPVRRVALGSLTEADIETLLTGREPLIVEGLEHNWPSQYRDAPLREVAKFAYPPPSVHIDGEQRFGVKPREFFEKLETGKNVRIFGGRLTEEMDQSFALPTSLQSRLKLFRYNDPKPLCFIGGGGAITLIHHDFELNANWHYVLSGRRQVYLWTYDQSPNLFKMPFFGFSSIPLWRGLLDCRFAAGYECVLNRGELLYMPPGCWHQIEYPEPSMAFTYAFHRTERERYIGTIIGNFWNGFMAFGQALMARRRVALLALPLLLPMVIFGSLYVPLMFIGKKLLRRAFFLIRLPMLAVESILFLIYYPLFNLFRKKLWVGH